MSRNGQADQDIETSAARRRDGALVTSSLRNRGHGQRPLEALDESGLDQQSIEPAGFRAVLAGVEYALATEHDVLLFLERGIERYAGGFLDYQWQIGRVDRVHDGRALDRFEIDGVDSIIGGEVARVVGVELARHPRFIQAGIEQVRRELRLMVAVANDQERLCREFLL